MSDFTVEAIRYQTPNPSTLERDRVVIAVVDGQIAAVAPADGDAAADLRARSRNHLDLGSETVLVPGLIDLHVHAPQWQQLGTALDLPVQDWLQTYTFPLEARFADTAMAGVVYRDLVTTLLAHGTTTAVYFASVHEAERSSWPKHAPRPGSAPSSAEWRWIIPTQRRSGIEMPMPHLA